MAVSATDKNKDRKIINRKTLNEAKEKRRLHKHGASTATAGTAHQQSVPQKTAPQDYVEEVTIGADYINCGSDMYVFYASWMPGSEPYENSWSLYDSDPNTLVHRSFMGCPVNGDCVTQICLYYCNDYNLVVDNSNGDGFDDGSSFYAHVAGDGYWIDEILDVPMYDNFGFSYDVTFSVGCDDYDYAVDGRPLIDANGIQRQAEAVEVDGKKIVQEWSGKKMVDGSLPTTKQNNKFLAKLSQEWTHRALGEHASIGSFAIFTMALLTNQAPSELIQASLNAAEDELRHAKVSFEVASLLREANGELPLEPSPYESTSYEFSNDMTTLAVGAAEEGCVDETISALVAAAEADYYGSQTELGEFSGVLQGATNTIAMEEGRHSILAWRTVHWACQKDVAACEAAKTILKSSKFTGSRFSGLDVDEEKVEKVWNTMHNTLVSIVTTDGVDANLHGAMDCSQSYESFWESTQGSTSHLNILADNIVHGVYCSLFPAPEAVLKAQM